MQLGVEIAAVRGLALLPLSRARNRLLNYNHVHCF